MYAAIQLLNFVISSNKILNAVSVNQYVHYLSILGTYKCLTQFELQIYGVVEDGSGQPIQNANIPIMQYPMIFDFFHNCQIFLTYMNLILDIVGIHAYCFATID